MRILKRAGLLALATVVSGCVAVELVSQDFDGRPVVNGAQAAELFILNCYNSPNGAAVKRNISFTQIPNRQEDTVNANHNSVSADFFSVDGFFCRMSFFGTNIKSQTSADTAAAIAKALNAEVISSNRGVPLAIKTPKGTISFDGGIPNSIRGTPRHPQNFAIWLSLKR